MYKKKGFLEFDKNIFLNWQKEYWWKPVDDVIYEIFKQPDERDIFRSKLYILSLCYKTNIEKRAPVVDIADNLLRSSEYRYVSRRLSDEPFNSGVFDESTEIYSLHYKIMKAIKKTTGANEPVFASKLLHFWKPLLFPILDSKAEKNLMSHKWVIENMRKLELQYETFFPRLKENQYDDRYCWYCFLLLHFSRYIQQKHAIKKEMITLKALDIYLYYLCEE